ncbi:MAG TPA: sensor histidine kinase [Chryseosolibacter sp.]|nr:sensor histidine kinase [Chryseosolibacter sp.]
METLASPKQEAQLNDVTIRLIGVPAFGIIIPNATGLFGYLTFRDVTYWLGYIYFITLAYLIWQGNRYLLFRTRKRFTWFDKPIEKLILLLVNNVFYTSPLTIAWLCVWYRIAEFDAINWQTILIVVLINVICVLFVTHVYETVFMVREQQGELLRNADLSRAKAEAELAALKNQIDPHFMFNSLNSLAYLISTDSAKASAFTENLAEVYRYILSQKDRTLVLLEDELSFTSQYAALLDLRFGNALHFTRHFNGEAGKKFLIPPTSVFVALENAVKHNEISERHPLHVDIQLKDNALIVTNRIRPKRNLQHSSGIGLRNLNERFKLTTGQEITSGPKDELVFQVIMPLTWIGASDQETNLSTDEGDHY